MVRQHAGGNPERKREGESHRRRVRALERERKGGTQRKRRVARSTTLPGDVSSADHRRCRPPLMPFFPLPPLTRHMCGIIPASPVTSRDCSVAKGLFSDPFGMHICCICCNGYGEGRVYVPMFQQNCRLGRHLLKHVFGTHICCNLLVRRSGWRGKCSRKGRFMAPCCTHAFIIMQHRLPGRTR